MLSRESVSLAPDFSCRVMPFASLLTNVPLSLREGADVSTVSSRPGCRRASAQDAHGSACAVKSCPAIIIEANATAAFLIGRFLRITVRGLSRKCQSCVMLASSLSYAGHAAQKCLRLSDPRLCAARTEPVPLQPLACPYAVSDVQLLEFGARRRAAVQRPAGPGAAGGSAVAHAG